MKILDRLPYATEKTAVPVRGAPVPVKAFQTVVWVSVSEAGLHEWDPRTPVLPAILDTGNNFTLAIHQSHLIRWAGIRPELLRLLGGIRLGGKRVSRHEADVWLHPNVAGRLDRKPGREPFRLNLHAGIAVYPDEGTPPPHLPLLGLRALTENKLHTTVDGEHRVVTLRTPDWFTALSRWLHIT